MTDRLEPGARIGILGGGQLGRMLAVSAARLGFDVVIYTPETGSPAGRVAAEMRVSGYEDTMSVGRFAGSVDVVTYEFENVPVESALAAAEVIAVRPGPRALEVSQDRVTEKRFLNDHGAPTADFLPVGSAEAAAAALTELGAPAILKTRRFGYDGKGQRVVTTEEEASAAYEALGGRPAILEAFVPFSRELSIVAARGLSGEIRAYPLVENRHAGGILRETIAPARVAPALQAEALRMATAILEALDYVGVLAVELFELEDGRLLVNEIAPRVHNTGHWTMDACACSQFEQHIRAVAGWPLGETVPHSSARMINLIGEDARDWARWLSEPGAVLHLYGKQEIRDGRKMGHVNVLGSRP